MGTVRPAVNSRLMPEQRDDNLDQIRRDGAFDVIVVGGGINGIGVFRELALQGLRVLLVERRDFCSGCSAAPSRMIHGGLRYLENGEFNLVRESLRERDALLVNAPHMVRPLPTTIPITSVFSGLLNAAAGFLGLSSKPASRGALPIKIGLSLLRLDDTPASPPAPAPLSRRAGNPEAVAAPDPAPALLCHLP